MDLIHFLFEIVFRLDVHLNEWAAAMGPWIYVLLFMIVFCETGLVVTPFLPGDSLLFALGALTASNQPVLSLALLLLLLSVAAVLGDATNYTIGRYIGPKVFHRENSFWLNKKHLLRAQAFYEKHGGKTIILARFMPIIRTFAPFVAGVGKMHYPRFALFNLTGGLLWVFSFLIAGNVFGNIPTVKTNFHIVIFGIIFLSILPLIIEFAKSRFSRLPKKGAYLHEKASDSTRN